MDQYSLPLINGRGPLCTIQHLKAKCDEALSNFAFSFNLRRHTKAINTLALNESLGGGKIPDWIRLPRSMAGPNPKP